MTDEAAWTTSRPKPWCGFHNCHPEECWRIHNPGAHEDEREPNKEDVETGYGDTCEAQ